ncbi:MAG: hypothetical protein M1830_001601 [Pleopsidium flavum]|nr:MAG: hypothetical protein M1830_001601 [Pleopsidium flavum]
MSKSSASTSDKPDSVGIAELTASATQSRTHIEQTPIDPSSFYTLFSSFATAYDAQVADIDAQLAESTEYVDDLERLALRVFRKINMGPAELQARLDRGAAVFSVPEDGQWRAALMAYRGGDEDGDRRRLAVALGERRECGDYDDYADLLEWEATFDAVVAVNDDDDEADSSAARPRRHRGRQRRHLQAAISQDKKRKRQVGDEEQQQPAERMWTGYDFGENGEMRSFRF